MALLVKQPTIDRMIAIRRDLHAHPELSWEEHRTVRQISKQLGSLEIEHRRVAGTGIIADLPGPPGSPTIALRADIDALPIHEETGLPFASSSAGGMDATLPAARISSRRAGCR